MPTTDGTWRICVNRDAARRWPVVPMLVASVLLFLSLALFLALRRLTGALVDPLPTTPLLVAAAITLAWSWSVRAIWAALAADTPLISAKADRLLVTWTPLAAMLLFAVACSFPGDRWIDWVVWLPAIAATWLGPWRRPRGRKGAIDSPKARPAEGSERILQQMTRFRAIDGREVVHGMMVAEFAPKERIATLHVAFCPPFECMPQVEAEAVEGPDANIKILQVLHNGARLDVQLSQTPDESETVSIELLAAEPEETPDPRSES